MKCEACLASSSPNNNNKITLLVLAAAPMHRSQIEQKCWSAQDEIKADSLWKLYKTLEAIPYHEIPADMGFAQLFSIATCFIEKYDVAENQKVSKCRDFTARISRSHSQQGTVGVRCIAIRIQLFFVAFLPFNCFS